MSKTSSVLKNKGTALPIELCLEHEPDAQHLHPVMEDPLTRWFYYQTLKTMSNWVFKALSKYKNGSVHVTDLLHPNKYHVKGLSPGRLGIKAGQHIVLGILGESVSGSWVSNFSQFYKNLQFLLCFGYPGLCHMDWTGIKIKWQRQSNHQ